MDNDEIVSLTIPLVKGKNWENRSLIFSILCGGYHKIRKAFHLNLLVVLFEQLKKEFK